MKEGGSYSPKPEALDDCAVIDVGFIGQKFRWCNNGAGAATISIWEWVNRVPSGGIRRMEGCHNGIELTIE